MLEKKICSRWRHTQQEPGLLPMTATDLQGVLGSTASPLCSSTSLLLLYTTFTDAFHFIMARTALHRARHAADILTHSDRHRGSSGNQPVQNTWLKIPDKNQSGKGEEEALVHSALIFSSGWIFISLPAWKLQCLNSHWYWEQQQLSVFLPAQGEVRDW